MSPATLVSQLELVLHRHGLPSDHCVLVGQAARFIITEGPVSIHYGKLRGLSYVDGQLMVFFDIGSILFSLMATEEPKMWTGYYYQELEPKKEDTSAKESDGNVVSVKGILETLC
jgi:hypothetical protein